MNLRHETNKIFTSSNKHRLENKILYQDTLPPNMSILNIQDFAQFFFFAVVGCNFHRNSSHNFIL